MEKHAIQLIELAVDELFFKVLDRDRAKARSGDEIALAVSRSEFDHDSCLIFVKMEGDISGDAAGVAGVEAKAVIAGCFSVDLGRFPVEQIHHWAENNAPLILLPYLREQLYSISVRAGVVPVLLPLIQVPTFKVVGK